MRFLLAFLFLLANQNTYAQKKEGDSLVYEGEGHFKNMQQLTFGGDNAEAYWSPDGKWIVFQRTSAKDGIPCDQIYAGRAPKQGEKFQYKLISTGKGRTTCAFFAGNGKRIVYASTHEGGDACPPVPDRSKYGNRYIWPLYNTYDIYTVKRNGKGLKKLVANPGYDAEATLSADGSKMVFTSDRNGDLDLYVMDMRTKKITQITNQLGYDGGAWFSADGKQLIWRASRPATEAEAKEYKDLLKEGMVAPNKMEVFVANADGSNQRQITSFGGANWAPNFTPDGNIIFCSNHEYKRGFPFNMYLLKPDGSGLQKISRDGGFDAFPMFSPDGKKIVFCSNRNNGGTRDTNVFIADWINN